ncbi:MULTISPECIES: very short patch repair endonuclease [unclassified Bradyrhizobium]|uniref:very short patch repair endonuclease n=1 Tax=unclassified Bradyrhizobium TaxID=2631580 RepID=UPI001CD48EB9|nr:MULTISPECIES: very short patch repair endonuclease [unclassified Bradyrhizobium]MCA1377000.1 DNA mismatch endonuclease Vsr [Bradyrhizobium sp. IC4060]MCA1484126.1 DNA mismatch endonuclease Vsr [Bradyrhizobium sp. IC4061]
MDKLTREQRSENMRRIRAKDTAPEIAVRKLLHGLGYRYRLHSKDLPGRPDLVFRSRHKAIFVHGCFWHAHDNANCPEYGRIVKTNRAYWGPKLLGNRARDERHCKALRDSGWSVLTVWDCELGDGRQLSKRLKKFLGTTGSNLRRNKAKKPRR